MPLNKKGSKIMKAIKIKGVDKKRKKLAKASEYLFSR